MLVQDVVACAVNTKSINWTKKTLCVYIYRVLNKRVTGFKGNSTHLNEHRNHCLPRYGGVLHLTGY
jgi:hypothetical protein